MPHDSKDGVDVLIRTFNSGRTLRDCLQSVVSCIPYRKILIADHCSTDGTPEIAKEFGADVHTEDTGLGYATKLLISLAETEYVLFVDSDVNVVSRSFMSEAIDKFKLRNTGAVVGCALGHEFLFGLPLGLTLFPLSVVKKIHIPEWVQGRETFYFEELLDSMSLKVRYVRNAMTHTGVYRNYPFWPEWQGAQIRKTPSRRLRQLAGAWLVVLLMHLNSRSKKNFIYSPVYYSKLVRGFMNPDKWGKMDRRLVDNQLKGQPR
ncbi:MAG: glycosyltransferase family 2 protein [Thermoplasmata archaeon]|uniref:Glycosyltransferase family 2 protein n=1 Tax=Candidatus Sysuiplasma superficiale TaxID=2823368 RepID=A0A8J8CDN7_9ARCH|nr:glycosyltransferase family 2 protein [Candidatus Sysuiplasma superficiale]MBX8643827.1 glycosyltransferase family 2 protein [Candidatus Sysuiplasma superficiale]MCL4347274.1 glycosyltransferase family 2 protein [Candidatus Thermoplasmatota archaeon]